MQVLDRIRNEMTYSKLQLRRDGAIYSSFRFCYIYFSFYFIFTLTFQYFIKLTVLSCGQPPDDLNSISTYIIMFGTATLISVIVIGNYIWKCSKSGQSQPQPPQQEVSQNHGLSAVELATIPESSFRVGIPLVYDITSCSICLEEFAEEDLLSVFPSCSHTFHKKSVEMYFRNQTTCPIRRNNIVQYWKSVFKFGDGQSQLCNVLFQCFFIANLPSMVEVFHFSKTHSIKRFDQENKILSLK